MAACVRLAGLVGLLVLVLHHAEGIKITALFPLTGSALTQSGRDGEVAARIAAEDIQADPNLPIKVELLYYDTRGTRAVCEPRLITPLTN